MHRAEMINLLKRALNKLLAWQLWPP